MAPDVNATAAGGEDKPAESDSTSAATEPIYSKTVLKARYCADDASDDGAREHGVRTTSGAA